MTLQLITGLMTFAFISAVTPGPNNLLLLTSGLNYGLRRSMPPYLGVNFGFTFMVLLVGLGLARVFDALPASYLILKTLSIVYLLYLAWKTATAAPPDADGVAGKPFTFLQAAAFQWVNPKAWAMSLTAVSAFTPPSQPLFGAVFVALIFGAMTLPSTGLWVMCGTQLRWLIGEPAKLRIFNITAAVLLVASLYPTFFMQ